MTSAAVASREVLAIVQHQQYLPIADDRQQAVGRGAARQIGQTERSGGRNWDEFGLVDRRQIDTLCAIVKLGGYLRRDLHRQPRLASAAGAGQRDEAILGKDARHVVHLPLASDEASQLKWKLL